MDRSDETNSFVMTRGSVDVEYLDMPQSGGKRVDSGPHRRLPDDAGIFGLFNTLLKCIVIAMTIWKT